MAKQLDPRRDLTFKINTQSGNRHTKEIKVLTRGGHKVADDQTPNPINDCHEHVQGKAGCVTEKLEAMGLAILNQNWIEFDTLAYKLKQLNPAGQQMADFFREQIADAVVRNVGPADIDEIRRKLTELGARDKTLDEGYEIGVERFKQLLEKKRRTA